MKIAITGTTGLAENLRKNINADWINCRINPDTGELENLSEALTCDMFINQAHVNWWQPELLIKFYSHWIDDDKKHIINISSRAQYPNISKGYIYAAQKAALNHVSNNLVFNSNKKCKITTLNLGLISKENHYQDIGKIEYQDVSDFIIFMLEKPELEFSEVTIQHKHNYVDVQHLKKLQDLLV